VRQTLTAISIELKMSQVVQSQESNWKLE